MPGVESISLIPYLFLQLLILFQLFIADEGKLCPKRDDLETLGVTDIDSKHRDPQMCTLYAPDIYTNLHAKEVCITFIFDNCYTISSILKLLPEFFFKYCHFLDTSCCNTIYSHCYYLLSNISRQDQWPFSFPFICKTKRVLLSVKGIESFLY